MSEKIWNDIEVDFLNKIYNYKGAVGVDLYRSFIKLTECVIS